MCVSPPKNPTGCDDRMPPSGRYTVMSEARRLTLMLLYPSVTCCPTVPSNTSSAALEDGIDMVTPDPPTVTRPVDATSATPMPSGGTKKSSALAAESAGVAIDSRPEVAPYGTVVAIEVLVTVPTSASVRLKRRRLFVVGDVTKLVPVMVTAVPARAIGGVKLLIVGASLAARTVKGIVLVPEPPDVVTTIVPVVAPAGTVVVICVGVEAVTTAGVPLKVTVLLPGVLLNPTPEIVTGLPT